MQKLLKDYLDELNKKQKRRRKSAIALTLVAVMLISTVAWNLAEYGVAMTGDPKCGLEEHQHSEACYEDVLICGQEESAGHTHTDACRKTEQQLVCGQEESAGHTHTDACFQTEQQLVCGQEESAEHTHTEACYTTVQTQICGQEESAGHTHSESCYTTVETYTCEQEESAGHTHTEACYEKQLVCGKEEHTHSDACFIDPKADVEDASVWNTQYANIQWKDAWGEDLATAAEKQIGYKESVDNYTVTENEDHKGYTRYGQFAGDVYADWDAAFVNFCMYYAGLEATNLFPKETETAKWYEKFAQGVNRDYLTAPAEYEPQVGDLVFFQRENEETENQMGIVSSYNKETNEIQVIEGNVDNAVKENKYVANDVHITAYLKISELEAAYKNDGAEAGEEETPEEAAPVAEELNYEDDQITVKVTASEVGIIPEGASLKVVPITKENAETEAQYQNVEAKLQEKAENEEYDIAGFLAYDISFVDVDGNKLEPNGKVNVSMDYKSPELPQEVVENGAADAEVTVLHLEEDENGEVKQIVDMGAEQKATVDTLATTEGEKVQSVELETESFSTFTIVWGSSNQVIVKYVDKDGTELTHEGFKNNIQIKEDSGDWVELKKYAPVSVEIDGNLYNYQAAHINSVNGTTIETVRYKDEKYQYRVPGDDDKKTWSVSGTRTIYLVYEKVTPLTTVATVDNSQAFTMKMVDLSQSKQEELTGAGGTVTFGGTYGDGTIKKGLLNSRITSPDGYPVTKESASLSKLFQGAPDVNHLFIKNIYDTTGYYEYSSFENYAYLGNNTDFTVYEQIGTPSDDAEYFYRRGNFMPYNNIEAGKFSTNRNLHDENGNELTEGSPRYNEPLYKTQGTNFQFGMMIEADFTQQRDGKATHNGTTSPMVFEFNGDDDMWVFIDDVLVLDIGGVHDAHSGKINFSTGVVEWTDCKTGETPITSSTTLKEIFEKAGVLPNGKSWTEEGAAKEFKGNTFADYTANHSFKMYYFERGAGASNLHVKFNLPTVPKNTINVQKVVQTEGGEDVNYKEDVDFLFEIKVSDALYANKTYKIIENNTDTGRTGTTDEKGQFTLKHNQTARFEGITESEDYQVKELGAYLNGYKVDVDGTTVWTPDDNKTDLAADSGKLNVGNKSTVVFINTVVHTATLTIEKKVPEGTTVEPGKKFPIELKFKDKLFDGTYKVGDTEYKATNGIIKLEAGQTATITGLPYGITFQARELLDGYYLPTYGITGNVSDVVVPGVDDEGNSNGVSNASATMNGDCTLTVTNEKVEIGAGSTTVNVDKTWDMEDGSYELPAYVTVTLYEDVNRNGSWDEGDTLVTDRDPQQLTAENDWKASWTNLPGDKAYVVKEDYPPGYKFVTTDIKNEYSDITQIGDRNTPNKNTKFNIGKNNLLLVKETNNSYFLWSPVDLKLSENQINSIANAMNELLNGAGNLHTDNITYYWGSSSNGGNANGIGLEQNENGWTLSFEKTSNWSMFWNFQYLMTQKIMLTNTIDTEGKTSLLVDKVWFGDSESDRPGSITVQLYQNEEVYGNPVVITAEDGWKHEFTNLPIFNPVPQNGKYVKYQYTVKETKIGDDVVTSDKASGYQSIVIKNPDVDNKYSFTIKNIKDWQIIKTSENSNGARLKDARFEMKSDSLTVYGKSGEDGVVSWYNDKDCTDSYSDIIPNGTYTLKETKAPNGYILSEENWTIDIENGYPTISSSKDGVLVLEQPGEENGGKYTCYFKNEAVFSLPSAGGSGIYWYIFSGVLLMAAAMLIIYKNKCKEVIKG